MFCEPHSPQALIDYLRLLSSSGNTGLIAQVPTRSSKTKPSRSVICRNRKAPRALGEEAGPTRDASGPLEMGLPNSPLLVEQKHNLESSSLMGREAASLCPFMEIANCFWPWSAVELKEETIAVNCHKHELNYSVNSLRDWQRMIRATVWKLRGSTLFYRKPANVGCSAVSGVVYCSDRMTFQQQVSEDVTWIPTSNSLQRQVNMVYANLTGNEHK